MIHHKLKPFHATVLAAVLSFTLLSAPGQPVAAQDEWQYTPRRDECSVPDKPVSSYGQATSGHPGSWLEEGTQANAVAHKVFDTLTQVYGTSGAFAAGVLGSLANESAFIEDRAETHSRFNVRIPDSMAGPWGAGTTSKYMLRFGMNSKTPVRDMAWYPRHKGDKHGGGGLFQFTPYTEFTNSVYWGKLEPDGWGASNQMAFVMEAHFGRGAVNPFYNNKPMRKLFAGRAHPTNVRDNISMMNPRDAATVFWAAYLRPAFEAGHRGYTFPRERDAERANAYFNPNNIPADPSKWGWIGTQSSGGPSGGMPVSVDGTDECEIGASFSALNPTDYTGSHGFEIHHFKGRKPFAKDGLPEELRQYAINPEVFGLKDNVCGQAWTSISGYGPSHRNNGECVALSKVLFKHLWSKPGSRLYASQSFTGNGGVLAANLARTFSWPVLDKPTFGALASHDSGSSAGHTFIVSHVFENGDILAVEQNSAQSGNSASPNRRCSWNYVIYTAESIRGDRFVVPPAGSGYGLSPLLQIAGGGVVGVGVGG